MSSQVMEEVKKIFRPEFLNRIDGIQVFHTLEKPEQRKIVKLLLDELAQRVKQQPGFDLDYTEEVVDYILEKGYNPQFGARPLRRTIQNEVEDYLSDQYLQGNFRGRKKVKLVMKDGILYNQSN